MRASLSLPADGFSTCLELFDDAIQRVEPRIPYLAVARDPLDFLFATAWPDPAVAHATDLLGGHEAGQFEHADVLLHARQGHVEPAGKVGDRRVAARKLFEHATAGGVGQGRKRAVEVGVLIMNHMVQY